MLTFKQDVHLETLLEMVMNGLEIGVTLNVSGQVVSGVLISETKYKQQFVEGLSFFIDDDSTRSAMIEQLNRTIAIEQPDEYIHLRDTKIFVGATAIPMGREMGALWRGKIAAIDGYILGIFS